MKSMQKDLFFIKRQKITISICTSFKSINPLPISICSNFIYINLFLWDALLRVLYLDLYEFDLYDLSEGRFIRTNRGIAVLKMSKIPKNIKMPKNPVNW